MNTCTSEPQNIRMRSINDSAYYTQTFQKKYFFIVITY